MKMSAIRYGLFGVLLIVGMALSAPSLSSEYPLGTMLAIAYGFIWPFVLAVPDRLMRLPASLRPLVFIACFPLLGLVPVYFLSRENYMDVAGEATLSWAFGSCVALLAQHHEPR